MGSVLITAIVIMFVLERVLPLAVAGVLGGNSFRIRELSNGQAHFFSPPFKALGLSFEFFLQS
jgi:hypothetical protein